MDGLNEVLIRICTASIAILLCQGLVGYLLNPERRNGSMNGVAVMMSFRRKCILRMMEFSWVR